MKLCVVTRSVGERGLSLLDMGCLTPERRGDAWVGVDPREMGTRLA